MDYVQKLRPKKWMVLNLNKRVLIDFFDLLNEFGVPVQQYEYTDVIESGNTTEFIVFDEEVVPVSADDGNHVTIFKVSVRFTSNKLNNFRHVDFLNFLIDKDVQFSEPDLTYDSQANSITQKVTVLL